ncbi:hypothetical protein VTO42DRAFT_855 [Malbranchea cinnamomea]
MLKIYKEAKVELRPSTAGSVISIPVPSSADTVAQRKTRFSLPPKAFQEDQITKDEDAFAKRYLATQGSVYFRKRKTYPRSFFWRVVEDGRVLELRSVDLTKSVHETHEALLTLRLEFQDVILPHGVALADPEDHEQLNVFVITSARQLYTFTLRPDFFRRTAAIDENIADWCKICRPAPLNFSYPHRLYASSPLELFISLDSGSLLRLTRKAGEDGSNWFPITFDEKPWGASLRGLVRWNTQQPIKYDGRTLDPNTPNAVAVTSDQAFAFVVSLNHTLKVWNLASHKLVASKDLLNRTRQQQEASRLVLNPADAAFIRVFNAERATEGGMYYVVTYSPHEDGQFKFWAVSGGLTSDLVIEDMFPNAKLRPADPDPSGSVFWNIVDFQIKPAEGGKGMALWMLWRTNTVYQLYSLHFDMRDLEGVWDSHWTGTALELWGDELPPEHLTLDAVDPTEKWLDYFFSPGRFTPEVLETALALYQDATEFKQRPGPNRTNVSLKQRIYSTVADSVPLRKLPDAEIDFTRYSRGLDDNWKRFWQIAHALNKKRREAISMAYDTYADMPWLVLADGCALVRECSGTELLLHNEAQSLRQTRRALDDIWPHRNLINELGHRPDDLSRLISVAACFRQRLVPELRQTCQRAFDAELFAEPFLPAPERLAEFHTRCSFSDLMSDDAFDSAYATIDHGIGFKKLCNDLFFSVVDTLPLGFLGKDSELISTECGRAATVQGAMETIWLSKQVLQDLILLAVFVETEIAVGDGANFDGVEVFATLIDLLKEYEMMYWLGSNVRMSPERTRSVQAGGQSISEATKDVDNKKTSTILEDLFAVHIRPRPTVGVPQACVVTQQIRDIISWVTRQGEVSLPNILVFIQCDLIACGNINLASDFLRFQPNSAWSTYVKGRLYVARSEFDIAATYFQKAAYTLSYGKAVGNLNEMSSNLLDLISVNNFYNGLPKYFQHVISVFEQARSFAHVSEFARLALQALESSPKKPEDYISVRTDLLSRLFHASLKTCRYDDAYSALSRYSDPALQKSALTSLITTILTASGPGTTGLNTILRFPLSLAGNLASHVDEVLSSLAEKQLYSSSSLYQAAPTSNWDDSTDAPDYSRILQAYRVARNDFRGAAEVAYRTVCRIRDAREGRSTESKRKNDAAIDVDEEDDLESKRLRDELLSLINLLACMEKNEAYILVEQQPETQLRTLTARRESAGNNDDGFSSFRPSLALGNTNDNGSGNRRSSVTSVLSSSSGVAGRLDLETRLPKRVAITLDDLRREYQTELDRVSRIQRGDWEFGLLSDDSGSGDPDMIKNHTGDGDGDVVMS